MKLFILSGVAGVGKTTLAKEMEKEYGAVVVSTDGIRKELFGDESCQDYPELVFYTAYDRIDENLKAGKDVVFDATNLTNHFRENSIKALRESKNAEIILITVRDTINECMKRNRKRVERRVPDTVIIKQYNRFQTPSKEFLEKYNIKYIDINKEQIKENLIEELNNKLYK